MNNDFNFLSGNKWVIERRLVSHCDWPTLFVHPHTRVCELWLNTIENPVDTGHHLESVELDVSRNGLV